jgi:N-acetylmuramoyl-L-alanine amidase
MLLKKEESNYSKKGGEHTLLNKNVMKKTSQVLVLAMLLMVFMPIIAFASTIFSGITYDGNNVSGSVYSDTYTPGGVTIKVYGPDKLQVIGAATATYSTYDVTSGVYKYTLAPFSLGSTVYSHVYLNAPSISTSVYEDAVYNITAPVSPVGPSASNETNQSSYMPTLDHIYFKAPSSEGTVGGYGSSVGHSVYTQVYAVYSDLTKVNVTSFASYSSDNASIATVNNLGKITSVALGTTVIHATYDSKSTSVEFAVFPVVSSIAVDSSSYSLNVGGTHNTTVTATFPDQTTANVTSSSWYFTRNSSIATVSWAGVVTAKGTGTTVIDVVYGGKVATVTVTVTNGGGVIPPSPAPVTLSSISLDSAAYTLTLGGTTTHNTVVTATYSDASTLNVSTYATYTGYNSSIVTVSSSGVVTAQGAGTTVITATYGTQTAQVTVTVTSSTGVVVNTNTTTTSTTVEAGADGKVDSKALTDVFKGSDNPQVKVKDVASLPASALIEAAKKAGTSLTITSENGTYVLPLSLLKLDDLAKSLGIAVADLNIKVSITKVSGTTATAVADEVKAIGATSLTDAIDFKVTAEGKDGKSVEINNFGNTYVSRSVTISKNVDMKKVTGVLYNEITKKLSFVPATFETKDGKTVATLKRNGNSIYTVVEMNKSFTDIASHWSKEDVSLLANKLVIDGATDTTFAPDLNITRGEFAALVVRSLGLNTDATSTTFADVKSSDWYAGAVAAAAGAKIINGYEDGSFKADAQITREELATMVVRALTFAGVKSDLSATQQATLLGKFTDAGQIIWADKEIAAAVDAGIINGLTDTTIGSGKQATRAEAATMLKRFLTKAGFIN